MEKIDVNKLMIHNLFDLDHHVDLNQISMVKIKKVYSYPWNMIAYMIKRLKIARDNNTIGELDFNNYIKVLQQLSVMDRDKINENIDSIYEDSSEWVRQDIFIWREYFSGSKSKLKQMKEEIGCSGTALYSHLKEDHHVIRLVQAFASVLYGVEFGKQQVDQQRLPNTMQYYRQRYLFPYNLNLYIENRLKKDDKMGNIEIAIIGNNWLTKRLSQNNLHEILVKGCKLNSRLVFDQEFCMNYPEEAKYWDCIFEVFQSKSAHIKDLSIKYDYSSCFWRSTSVGSTHLRNGLVSIVKWISLKSIYEMTE